MSTVNDGGPAFPQAVPAGTIGAGCGPHVEWGMTLRDYFANSAMQSIFAGEGARIVANRDDRYDETNWAQVVAANAYEMADAMIAHRAGKGLQPSKP